MRKLLTGAAEIVVIVHPYLDLIEGLKSMVDTEYSVCVIPQRDPEAVRASWIKYGKNPNNFAGMSLKEWYDAQYSIAERAPTYYLQLDRPSARDVQLAEINRELGLNLETDWEPVRQEAC
jgi:hypothetical protein